MGLGWKLGIPVWKHFLLGTDLGGVGKNRHSFYVVNVNKRKKQVKQIKMFCFAEIFSSYFHDSKILLDVMKIYNYFSIEIQRINEIK